MILVIIVLVLLIIRYFCMQWKYYKSSWNIEGPLALPIVGNGLLIWDMDYVFGSFTRLRRHFKKPLMRIWLGVQYFIYTDDPIMTEAILNHPNCLDKGRSYRFLSMSLGDGLVTLNGETWKIHRKLLNPSFQYNIINSFMNIFNNNGKRLLRQLDQMKEDEVFDAFEVLTTYSMNMICETTMDLRANAKWDYLEAAHKAIAVTVKRMFQTWYQPYLVYRFSSLYKPNEKNLKTVFSTIENIIEEKKSVTGDQSTDVSKNPNIFLDRILKLEEASLLNHDEVVNEVNTILMAGYETTATSASYVLLVLAMYPEYQEQVFEEIKSIFPDKDEPITQEHLKELTFLDLVIKETLRVFPSVPFLTRLATKDIILNNKVIPAGTEFLIDIYQMHRNKSHTHIDDPDQFNPYNFLPENIEKRHPYSYIPFSAGQRNCIGMRYGQIVTKMVVIDILRHFKITTKLKIKDLRFRMHITLQLINKHLMSVQKRDSY